MIIAIPDQTEYCFKRCVEKPCSQEEKNICSQIALDALKAMEHEYCPQGISRLNSHTDGLCGQVAIGFVLGGALGARKAINPQKGE